MFRLIKTLVIALAFVLIVGKSSHAAFTITNPAGVDTADVNAVGRTLSDEIGNISLADFNALERTTFDFEDFSSGVFSAPVNSNLPGTLIRTSPVDEAITVMLNRTDDTEAVAGGTFALVSSGEDSRFTSSGDGTIVIDDSLVSIDTNDSPLGFGFVIARATGPITVSIYSDSTRTQLIDNFVTTATGDGSYTFVGFQGDTSIASIFLSYPGGSGQYAIDDLSFTFETIPEPASLMLVAAGASLMLMRRRK